VLLRRLCSRFRVAEGRVAELLALSEKHGLPTIKGVGELLQGCICAATDRFDQANLLIASGVSAIAETRTTLFAPLGYMWLARTLAARGRPAEAQDALSKALDAVSKTNERWDEAEIHRAAGEIAASHPHVISPDRGELHFQRSLTIARRQDAKSLELRAATSLARLWRGQGRRDEARELLAPVVSWFTEGFEMSDLREAKALLET
jgi:predicted ATPase